MSRNSYHTHTTFCDGKDTPEELILRAIELGCTEIGFSGHSFTDIPDEDPFCMTENGTGEYKREIRRLREKYRDRIRVLLGVEQDFYSESDPDFEYVIGSVHYVLKDGTYIPVDESPEMLKASEERFYGGDYYALAEDYYALVGDIYRKTRCDIVGHFDLITKFNEGNRLFDTSDPRYEAAADGALEKLLGEPVCFEVNFGAVARGYRTEPYPEKRIMEKIRQAGKKLIYTSDCHDRRDLLFGIPETEEYQFST